MKTFDIKFSELCDEIDYYKFEAERWKAKYEELKNETTKKTSDDLTRAQRDVGNALMFAFHVKDDENGNLVINKEDRKELTKRFK
jgi:hypothetical protein